MKPRTRYADFQGAGVVQRTEPLSENSWKVIYKQQFDYIDNLIGDRPEGR